MIHVYRDATARSVGFWGLFVPVFLFFVGFLVLALLPFVGGEGDGFGWDDLMVLGVFGAPLVLVLVYLAFKRQGYEECREIRLDDGGTCELETASGRVIRIHVNEITSVRYSRDSDSDSESYTIRYQGRELYVTERMTDFLDFLTRLKALNPRRRDVHVPSRLTAGPGRADRTAWAPEDASCRARFSPRS